MNKTEKLLDRFEDALGYDGAPVDEDEAIRLVQLAGVHALNESGETPLSNAAKYNGTRVIKWLLENSASVDYVDPDTDDAVTPLLAAAYYNRLKAAEILLDHGADIEAVDQYNSTPLTLAFANTFTDPLPLARLLVTRGAKVTERVEEFGNEWDSDRFADFLASINGNE